MKNDHPTCSKCIFFKKLSVYVVNLMKPKSKSVIGICDHFNVMIYSNDYCSYWKDEDVKNET